jgi:hypothetical protein
VEIADDGTFLFREAVRINFGHLVAQQFDGDNVNVSEPVGSVSDLLSSLQLFDFLCAVDTERLGELRMCRHCKFLPTAEGCQVLWATC